MTVEGINGIGMSQTGSFETNGNANADTYTKGIQKQIEDAQQRLQKLSSNEELSIEDKMKKRQEIQKEIQKLNQELRQHQMEKRKNSRNRHQPIQIVYCLKQKNWMKKRLEYPRKA